MNSRSYAYTKLRSTIMGRTAETSLAHGQSHIRNRDWLPWARRAEIPGLGEAKSKTYTYKACLPKTKRIRENPLVLLTLDRVRQGEAANCPWRERKHARVVVGITGLQKAGVHDDALRTPVSIKAQANSSLPLGLWSLWSAEGKTLGEASPAHHTNSWQKRHAHLRTQTPFLQFSSLNWWATFNDNYKIIDCQKITRGMKKWLDNSEQALLLHRTRVQSAVPTSGPQPPITLAPREPFTSDFWGHLHSHAYTPPYTHIHSHKKKV